MYVTVNEVIAAFVLFKNLAPYDGVNEEDNTPPNVLKLEFGKPKLYESPVLEEPVPAV